MSEDRNNPTRRKVLAASVCALGGVGVGAMGTVLVRSLQPPPEAFARTLQAQRRIVNIAELKPGEFRKVVVGEREISVMLLRRTESQLRTLERFEDDVADPTSQESQQPNFARNRFRSIDPELLVVDLQCTHLGCEVNYYAADDPVMRHRGESWHGGFYCPCHAATFDLAGRVHKGMPAPINLVVPPHKFLSRAEVLIGRNQDEL